MNAASKSVGFWPRLSVPGALVSCVWLTLAIACVPEVDDDPSLALDGQILAIQFDPAEAKPEASTQVHALVASEEPTSNDEVAFALCVARKPLSELGPVHPDCLGSMEDNDALKPQGTGPSVTLVVPKDTCSLFGPQRPAPTPGQPPGRPVDPDGTGGFYQPVIANLGGSVLGSLRLNCGLPGGTQAQVSQYNQEHVPNQNPAVKRLEISVAGGEWERLGLDEPSIRVPRNKTVRVRSEWEQRERYLLLSPESRQLTRKKEELTASFYSTVGGFDEHRVKLDTKSRVSSDFRTPSERGKVRVWIVVRDGRSGTGWTSLEFDVH